MTGSIKVMLFQHGNDGYSLWYPEIPADEPLLAALFEKYGNNGSSMHGTAHDAGCELLRSMNAAAHVIVYNDPRENYVGVDVFTNFEAALACWDGEHQRAMGSEEERGVVHTVRNVKEQEFYFRTERGFECFYRKEALQYKAFEMHNE